MRFIIPISLYFITSVTCLPFFSSYKSMFSRECATLIQHQLDTQQGLQPSLKNTVDFGYIYSMDTPTVQLDQDFLIQSSPETELFPSQVAVVLSALVYDESNTKLIAKGRISLANSDKLQQSSIQGSTVKLQFNIFGSSMDNEWYSKLGSTGDITAVVKMVNLIEPTEDQDKTYRDVIVELQPKYTLSSQYLELSNAPNSMQQIVWSGPSAVEKNPCKTSKRDRIYEIIDSAVLL